MINLLDNICTILQCLGLLIFYRSMEIKD